MNATGEAVSIRSSNKRKKTDYTGSKEQTSASDCKVIKADGTVEWIPSKKKYVKNYGEVKFSGEKE